MQLTDLNCQPKKAESIAVERFPRVTASDKLQRADWEIVKACPSCCKAIREDSGQDNLYRARLESIVNCGGRPRLHLFAWLFGSGTVLGVLVTRFSLIH